NNGGDGFVIARYLTEWNYKCEIYFLGSVDKMTPETKENYLKCQNLNIPIIDTNVELPILDNYHVIIDAILGIGLQGIVRGFSAEVIKHINNAQKLSIAIDIPSGVDADSGQAEIAVNCQYTLTMAAIKQGLLIGQGQRVCGEIFIIDIGIPAELFTKFPPRGKLLTKESVQYPQRNSYFHKGDYGKIGIIAGSKGLTGAAIMASAAALRAGAGLVTLFHQAGLEQIFECQLIEVMTKPIQADVKEFLKEIETQDVLLLGPGIGKSDFMRDIVKAVLINWKKPLVLDADALNIIAANNWQNMLDNPQIIITPHLGEFARLQNVEIKQIYDNSLAYIDQFIQKYRCAILLKSATTIYADSQNLIFDTSGNDGLATGGSGDVLAGIFISFLGQKLPIYQAASAASFLLGKTAEKLADKRKAASIIPTDIINEIFKY
ncbi:MAG: NAD(P)H-hydrate dehydratase, partial [Candidatus Cloacimonetes bacterium]|nr:NAD(P)H-hydrate dehydratase [Candidatus Cloacimonadota bacterium]